MPLRAKGLARPPRRVFASMLEGFDSQRSVIQHPWPVFLTRTQTFHDWILANVVRFQFELPLVANAMIEESVLPGNVV
jgi:hypothetical protein